MDLGLANGIYTNKLDGNANGLYDSIRTGLHNGIYNKNLLPANIVKNNLVLYLDSKYPQSYSRSGIIYNDLSIKKINGTLTNFGSQTVWNNNDASIDFGSSGGYIDLGNNFNFEYNNSFSLCGWFYFNNDNDMSLISKQEYLGNYRGYVLRKLSNYQLMFGLVNTTSAQVQVRATANLLSANNWFYLVATYNGNNLASGVKLYINSEQVTTTITQNNLSTSTIINTVPFKISTLGTQNVFPINGRNGIVTIYNKELTQSEINQNYQATKSRFNL